MPTIRFCAMHKKMVQGKLNQVVESISTNNSVSVSSNIDGVVFVPYDVKKVGSVIYGNNANTSTVSQSIMDTDLGPENFF